MDSLHVVVEVKVVQVLPVDEEVEHVVALATDLESGLDPVERRRLEELGRLDCSGSNVRCCTAGTGMEQQNVRWRKRYFLVVAFGLRWRSVLST